MRCFRLLVLATAAVGGVLLAPAVARAHAMHADVTVGKEVKVLAYYDEDVPAEFAEVTVTDATGAVVLKGKTDERGLWTFPRPEPGTYTLLAKSVGHTAKVKFVIPGGGGPAPAPRAPGAGAVAPEPPEEEAVTYTEWRPSKAQGLAIGGGGLVGFSALYWLARRRRWVE